MTRSAIPVFLVGTLFMGMMAFSGCHHDKNPRPRGYIRIDMPDKEYRLFDSIYPYTFLMASISRFVPDTSDLAEDHWGNIVYPDHKATIHLSYKPVGSDHDLNQYFEDARTFAQRHIPKATSIREEVISHESRQTHGVLYQIRGKEAASPIQFYVTDSTDHFLRGALYFEVTPNNDSLAPVIRYIEEDIRQLMESLEWRRSE